MEICIKFVRFLFLRFEFCGDWFLLFFNCRRHYVFDSVLDCLFPIWIRCFFVVVVFFFFFFFVCLFVCFFLLFFFFLFLFLFFFFFWGWGVGGRVLNNVTIDCLVKEWVFITTSQSAKGGRKESHRKISQGKMSKKKSLRKKQHENQPSKHTTSQERRYNVAATSWRCIDVVGTLCVCWEFCDFSSMTFFPTHNFDFFPWLFFLWLSFLHSCKGRSCITTLISPT